MLINLDFNIYFLFFGLFSVKKIKTLKKDKCNTIMKTQLKHNKVNLLGGGIYIRQTIKVESMTVDLKTDLIKSSRQSLKKELYEITN